MIPTRVRLLRPLGTITLSLALLTAPTVWSGTDRAPALVGSARHALTDTTGHITRQDTIDLRDPIARMQSRLDAGEQQLEFDSTFGYLPSLLRQLDIPVSSQGLVFSRTSLQTDRIAPWAPRALYYNDDVYIGFVQESPFLEIAAMHPTKGAIFYTLNQERLERPQFTRETTTCLMCHQSRAATGGVPGLMMLSTITDRLGYPIVGVHENMTTDETPVRERFGGWYVTGTHAAGAPTGAGGHSGNVHSPKLSHEVGDKQRYRSVIDMTTASDLADLSEKFDTTRYLTGQSDIVALMVLAHQTVVHNRITAVHEATHDAQVDLAIAGPARDSAEVMLARAPQVRLRATIHQLVRALLFADEAPLGGPLRGTTSFAVEFTQRGPRDHLGRSLREFDLTTRLFRYPLSFLIYSETFDALPALARQETYRQLRDVLNGRDTNAAFAHLTDAQRSALDGILSETKPDYLAWR